MPIRSILVPLNGLDSDQATLDLALAVARDSDAHIAALWVKQDPGEALAAIGMGAEGMALQQVADRIAREAEEASAGARRGFDAWRTAHDLPEVDKPGRAKQVSVAYRERIGPIGATIVEAGRVVDLIVQTGLSEQRPRAPELAIEAALFETGRPVLIAAKTSPAVLFDTAVVAWNGSLEANRAVAAAMPLLVRYKQLFVFCHTEPHRPSADSMELIDYFAWHGLKADRLAVYQEHGAVGPDLLAAAKRVSAGLLVMGAYTHGRLRQMLFGGVTDHVLRHAVLPVLFAH